MWPFGVVPGKVVGNVAARFAHTVVSLEVFQVQLVKAQHERQIGFADGLGQVVHRAPAYAQQFGLARDGELVVTVDHALALSNPALVSACSKKSFSKVNWPILACKGTRSTGSPCPMVPPKMFAA